MVGLSETGSGAGGVLARGVVEVRSGGVEAGLSGGEDGGNGETSGVVT
jgi:hypothetical protein